ncbi:MAG: PQQ-binding-like beta-propeller repeat protein [Bryobacterales bacterium]|nr:PQQ-binding-like beta-propeller repeat protein [Bryobacterales bacterium]
MRYLILLLTASALFASSLRAQLAEPPTGVSEGMLKDLTKPCPANPELGSLNASPVWSGWGGADNARFQTKAASGLTPADVPKLNLKWAFGFPGGASMYSQPAVAFGRVFVGNDNGVVYSLDAKTGCTYWAYQADMFGRFAPIAAPISSQAGTTYAIFFVTRSTNAYALNAHNGKLLWKTQVRTGLNNLSATAAYHDGRLFVPLSGTETMVGADPNYECCRSRGAVAALDANTGKVLWLTQSIQEPLREAGENASGKQRWGPAGASVWNTPTVDAKRGLIYVGTGNNFGRLAAATSDSILALRITDGKMMWHHQEFEGDTFMARCQATNPADSNCPDKLGPDYDFGGSSAILQTVNGKDILLAAGKGGVAIALDPDQEGKLLWRTQLWEGQAPSASGLVVWGGAADGARVYYPLQQPGGGLKALEIKTGKVAWNAAINADRRGQAGPASAIPGVVFTGGWDGILRAVDAGGKVIWSVNALRDFETVNGVPAKGGSFGSAGPVIAGGMVFATSGYKGTLRGTPGNVLLAFGVE